MVRHLRRGLTTAVLLLPEMYAVAGEDRKQLAARVREAMIMEYEKYA